MSFRTGCLAALLGSILAHLVAFALAFLWGAIVGAGEIMASGPGHTTYGLDGGLRMMAILGFVYIITIGVVPLAVSAGGAVLTAVLALGVGWLRGRNSAVKQNAGPT